MSTKLSVSLPEEDVAFLDYYAAREGSMSRSAALQRAVQMLRASELEAAYEDAWREWEESGEAEVWDAVTSDGLVAEIEHGDETAHRGSGHDEAR